MLSLATFVALGLPDGMIGTAWPSIRQTFGLPVGDLGLVLVASTAGSVVVTLFVGFLVRRLGIRLLVATGLACATAASTGFAVAPVFAAMLGIAVLFGVSAGLMDGGLNTAVGLSGRPRLLNLLHASYGVGTTIGPLVVTVALLNGSWRPAYVVLLSVSAILGGLWLIHRTPVRPVASGESNTPESPVHAVAAGAPHRYGWAIAVGIVVFFVYTGLEVSAGQWETTFARTHLRLSASAAGLATFGYWGALTAGRLGLALVPRPPAPAKVVRSGCLIAVASAGLIWWGPATAATIAGFIVMGASLAGIFPALIALTPRRLGEHRASNVIAWQVGAASAGGAGISALVGLFINLTSVASLGPLLLGLAVVLLVVEVVLTRLAPLPP